jgi:hypothetical protein
MCIRNKGVAVASRVRIPRLANPNIVIRLAQGPEEIEAADRLVFQNYVNLYWPDDIEAFHKNKYLSSSARHVGVAIDAGRVIATMSMVADSALGLPSDAFRPEPLRRFRQAKGRLGEMTSFATDQSVRQPMSLVMLLFKFFFQYSFYYADVDRVVASCRTRHADFYEKHLGFEKLMPAAPHPYAGNVVCQFVTLDMLAVHERARCRYGEDAKDHLHRFFMVDEHPNVRLPAPRRLPRARPLKQARVPKQGTPKHVGEAPVQVYP